MSMAAETAHLWSAAELLSAGARDPRSAHGMAAAGSAHQGRRALHPAYAEGANRDERAIAYCHQRSQRGDRTGHYSRSAERPTRPAKISGLARPAHSSHGRRDHPQLAGNWKQDVLFELQQAVDAYDFYQKQMAACDTQLKSYLAALPTREALPTTAAGSEPAAVAATGKKRRPRKPQGNQPDFDLAAELERILGVDATRIDGIEVMTIQTVLAEVGPDLSAWKTAARWCSWLNLAPKRDISGGKVIRHRREYRTNRVGNAFRMAAQSLVRSQSYLGARYRYLRARLGGLKAVKAMARVLACLYYRLVKQGQIWIDRGTLEFEQRRQQRDLASLQRKARSLGMQLVPAA